MEIGGGRAGAREELDNMAGPAAPHCDVADRRTEKRQPRRI